jgi:hypothetical protein
VAAGSAFVGFTPGPPAAAPGIKPIIAVRLEEMSKLVWWLVIELQHDAVRWAAP